jgi:peptide-methionine (S)-S-oxide reductase
MQLAPTQSRKSGLPVAIALAAGLIAVDFLSQGAGVKAAENATPIPPPAVDQMAATSGKMDTAVFAGGCFWGVQAVFQHVNGVQNAVSGYAGGTAADPTYSQVSSGTTGHAESVEVTYDPAKISYGKLLQIFFSVAHDPTQLNRQGPDVGTQYRSAVFFTGDEQKKIATAYVEQLGEAGSFAKPIATELSNLNAFYPAEDYHQDYAYLHPDQLYIVWNDLPKVEHLKEMFPDVWRDKPKLVRTAGAS